MGLIELIIVVLVILWLLGYFGRGRVFSRGPSVSAAPPWGGSWVHTLIVLALILLILRLLRVI
jgi:hypothetical protein